MKRLFAAVTVTVMICGCNSGNGSLGMPTSPFPASPAPPPPVVNRAGALSGIVYEVTPTGDLPLEGVHVYWSEYRGTDTDRSGHYNIADVLSGVQPVWVAKEGYKFAIDVPHPLGEPWRDVLVDGDTRFDIRLVRR